MSNVPGIEGEDLLRWNVLAYKRNRDLSQAEQREWNHLVRLHDNAVKAARVGAEKASVIRGEIERLVRLEVARRMQGAGTRAVASPADAGTPLSRMHTRPVPEAEPGSALEYSRRHYIGHISGIR